MSIRNPPSGGRHIHLQPETERLSRSVRSVRHAHEHTVEPVRPAPYGATEFYLVGLFLGIQGTLMMAVVNARRLGRPAHVTPVILVGLLLLAAIVLIPMRAELFSYLWSAVSIIFVIGAVEWQKPDYRGWMHTYHNEQPTWSQRGGWWSLASIIGGALVLHLVVQVLHIWVWSL